MLGGGGPHDVHDTARERFPVSKKETWKKKNSTGPRLEAEVQ